MNTYYIVDRLEFKQVSKDHVLTLAFKLKLRHVSEYLKICDIFSSLDYVSYQKVKIPLVTNKFEAICCILKKLGLNYLKYQT